jgi:hypothetical protein
MTSTLFPEDRARLIVEAFKGQTFSEPDDVERWLQRKIIAAISDAEHIAVKRALAVNVPAPDGEI